MPPAEDAANLRRRWSESRPPSQRSSSIRTPLLKRGLIDVVHLHVLPRLLGDGTRLYDVAGGPMRKLQNLVGDDPIAATNLRFRTTYEN